MPDVAQKLVGEAELRALITAQAALIADLTARVVVLETFVTNHTP